MKTTLPILCTVLGALAFGCTTARSPEMYRDDTQKLLDSKSADVKACYDNFLGGKAGPGGRVTVKLEVSDDTGKIENVAVDPANTTAPGPLADCVKNSLQNLTLNPVDAKRGQAVFVYEFSQPPQPPAPPPMAAPKS